MTTEAIRVERDRRLSLWRELAKRGGPDRVAPAVIRELRLHRGQQGCFRDSELTASLTPSGEGLAVGLLHTGTTYPDDLSDDGVIYHYPRTQRGRRDGSEIAAMKACGHHTLPVFIVITPSPTSDTRNVRLGWITDHDDAAEQLLIVFSESPVTAVPAQDDAGAKFELRAKRRERMALARVRPGQTGFRFAVFKRYGSACAFCTITEPKLLEAAHLCSVEESGSDDPRNGLVMCPTHHKAFDAGLLHIEPDSGEVRPAASVDSLAVMGVTRASITHLKRQPHGDALKWAWVRCAGQLQKE